MFIYINKLLHKKVTSSLFHLIRCPSWSQLHLEAFHGSFSLTVEYIFCSYIVKVSKKLFTIVASNKNKKWGLFFNVISQAVYHMSSHLMKTKMELASGHHCFEGANHN